MKQFQGILLAMISSATFGMIPLFALPVIRGGMGVDSVMFYRFALSSAVVGAYLLLRRADLRVTLREFGVLFGLGALYAFTALLLTIAYLFRAGSPRRSISCIRCWSPRSWRCFSKTGFRCP